MKLKALKSIPQEERKNLSTLYGVYAKSPVAIAKCKNNEWIVLQHRDRGPLQNDKKLVQTGSCKNQDEVLEFLNNRQMAVFCKINSGENKSSNTDDTSAEKGQKQRKYYRKEVLLSGEYTNTRTGSQGRMMVKDLSFYGVSFTTNKANDFEYEDIIKISFELDTPKRPVIHRKIQVRHLDGFKVGGQIINPPEMDYDLGAYLLP